MHEEQFDDARYSKRSLKPVNVKIVKKYLNNK